MRSLELLTLEEDKDWEDLVAVNKDLAKALTALNREEEAQARNNPSLMWGWWVASPQN